MEINGNELKEIGDYEIIDLRDEVEYKKYHLSNSQNVLFSLLLIKPDVYLKKNKTYLLICEYGLKSKKVSEILNNNGYHTYSLSGGIKNII